VRKSYEHFYGADAGELIVSGDFNAAELQNAAPDLLGSWNSRSSYTRVETPYRKTEAMNRKSTCPTSKCHIRSRPALPPD
jgi:predicted Zn-dependent peptidase